MKRKSCEDPMNSFSSNSKKYIEGSDKSDYSKSDSYSADLAYKALKFSNGEQDMKETKRQKEKKKKHKSKKYSSFESSSSSEEEKTKKKTSIEQLRKERLAREERERKRAEELIKQKAGIK